MREREINHIATGMSPQPRWRTTPSSSWEGEMVMKMAPVLMKMAPGALPRPGRVPEQRLLSPETEFRMVAEHGVVFANMTNRTRVYASGPIYRRRGGIGAARGSHTIARCGPPWATPSYGVVALGPHSVSRLDFVFSS